MSSLITISDPLASSVASISQVIVSLIDLQKGVIDKATPEQVQRIVDDILNLMAPFNSLVRAIDHKLGVATVTPEVPK